MYLLVVVSLKLLFAYLPASVSLILTRTLQNQAAISNKTTAAVLERPVLRRRIINNNKFSRVFILSSLLFAFFLVCLLSTLSLYLYFFFSKNIDKHYNTNASVHSILHHTKFYHCILIHLNISKAEKLKSANGTNHRVSFVHFC